MTPVAVPRVKTRYRRIVTNSLPLSAVIGRADVMNRYVPGSMTSTHSASPVAAAAALENLKILTRERLAARAAGLERPLTIPREALLEGCAVLEDAFAEVLG